MNNPQTPSRKKPFPTALIISVIIAIFMFVYGIYSYFDILAWEKTGQFPHIGPLSNLMYSVFGAIGIVIGYSFLALIVIFQGYRSYKNIK
ncbi:hypothetical protein [Mannheimia massilioguelmaensis]|uniref:hypothetical protein n=1 Tax=Mannheimia massilioguelmaensis TaxID=1604354 RepID=UPI0005CA217F|nr:hypothetical protein [Mannheimia massilioguelmaensis]